MVLTDIYTQASIVKELADKIARGSNRLHVSGLVGSMPAIVASAVASNMPDCNQLFIANNKEEAYYPSTISKPSSTKPRPNSNKSGRSSSPPLTATPAKTASSTTMAPTFSKPTMPTSCSGAK